MAKSYTVSSSYSRCCSKSADRGFTLAELLIVIAVVAVLVAISIPIFSSQLEKAREATDLANVRAAYAEVMSAAVQQDTSSSLCDSSLNSFIKSVKLKQKKDGWTTNVDKLVIGGIASSDTAHWIGEPKAEGQCTVSYSNIDNDVTLSWDGYSLKRGWQWNTSGGKLTINNTSYNTTTWPASAIPNLISAKNNNGQQIVVDQITDKYPAMKAWLDAGGGYEIGYFITDANGKTLYDSGGQKISADSASSFSISTDAIADGADVKIAIQFFKMKSGSDHDSGSVEMDEKSAQELLRIFSVQ